MSKKKIALITNVPAAYRLDFYEALSQESSIEFKVFFYGLSSQTSLHCCANLNNHFINYELTNSLVIRQHNRESSIPIGILNKLVRFKPDILITIGNLIPTSLASLYSKIYHVPLYLWWGGVPFSAINKINFEKTWRKLIFLQSSGIIAYCQQAKTDLISLEYPEEKILVLGNATFNVNRYIQEIDSYSVQQPLSQRVTLLAIGQLTQRKNYLFLLEVFQKLTFQYPDLHLIIIGEGEQKQTLEDTCHQYQLHNVQLLGHISNDQLLPYYAKADIFLHPSLQDQWPQVLNEAMAAGLPVVISPHCGVENELVYNQNNGYILPLEYSIWVEHLQLLITDKSLREQMGLKSREIISNFMLDKIKTRFLDFIFSHDLLIN